jgi:uncharacterized membrane protein YphA (DoxX/SURF4 family)
VDGVLAVARLILAVPFAVAGLRKLADPLGSRRTVAAWGVPARLVGPAVGVLTLAETAVAAGLMSGTAAWFAAVAALGSLLVPVVPAAVAMARGGADCTGLSVVVRAAALAIPAAVVAGTGRADAGPDVIAWLGGLSAGQQVAVGGGVAALAVASAGLRIPVRRSPAGPVPDDGATAGPVPAADAAPGTRAAPALCRPGPELTIGMATYDDFDGVYFTLQALRLYHDLDGTELLVVDNHGCAYTRELVSNWAGGTYVLANDVTGTAVAKDLVFRRASGAAVLCCDSHVLFAPGAVARLKRFYRENPDCADLLQGPLVYDDGRLMSTHFDPVWSGQMWGTWATDPRGSDLDGEPFEIPMQGLGVFSCRADAWLGFHPGFRGFGGEEGYIHEKFRRAGRRCMCLPWLRWMHRFGRPRGVPYPLTIEDKLRNYLLGHAELGLDPAPVLTHFAQYLPAERVALLADEAAAVAPAPPGPAPPRPAMETCLGFPTRPGSNQQYAGRVRRLDPGTGRAG